MTWTPEHWDHIGEPLDEPQTWRLEIAIVAAVVGVLGLVAWAIF